jgi:hypothetical protein
MIDHVSRPTCCRVVVDHKLVAVLVLVLLAVFLACKGLSPSPPPSPSSTLNLTTAGENQTTLTSVVPTTASSTTQRSRYPILPAGIDVTPSSTQTIQPAPLGTIPSSYFGLHAVRGAGFPLAVSYGNFRLWDAGPTVQWQGLHVCNSTDANCQSNPQANTSLSTSALDGILANLYSAGVNDVFYTGGRVPAWAQGTANYSLRCNYGRGSCVLPAEMNPDGSCSGANSTCSIWDTFWHLLATHVNSPTFLQTHAHIRYYEPWNEWFEDPVIGGVFSGTEVNASWAEMLRMTEDMRCVIKGVGTIHNYPTAGTSVSCGFYLSTLGWSGADANAVIVAPDSNDGCCTDVMQNFLYCNRSPQNDNGSSSTCTWVPSSNNPANCDSSSCWGSAAVDAISMHFYFNDDQPEQEEAKITHFKSLLSSADAAKPLINGEASSGVQGYRNNIWNDNYSAAAGLVRAHALDWSAGITLFYWYAYNTSGILYNGGLTPQGIAYNTAYQWLVGSTPVKSPFCSQTGTVYTCPLVESNGRAAEIVWDSQYGPGGTTPPSNCSAFAQPKICGSTSYAVPAVYQNGDWVDSGGTAHVYISPVTIGAAPILIEGP